jgi:hypothetical protein
MYKCQIKPVEDLMIEREENFPTFFLVSKGFSNKKQQKKKGEM